MLLRLERAEELQDSGDEESSDFNEQLCDTEHTPVPHDYVVHVLM